MGRVLAIPSDARGARARVVVPKANLSADEFTVGRTRLFVQYRDGGPSLVKMFALDGKLLGELPAEPLSDTSIDAVLDGDNAIVRTMSFITPSTRYLYDAVANRLAPTALNGKPPFNFDDATVERAFAVSKDGTRVPVTLLHAKGVEFDGSIRHCSMRVRGHGA
jgi:prolyl oligopeptidase